MGWLRKKFKQVGKKLKKFFKSDVGKALGTIALAVAGFYAFGPAAAGAGGTAGATAGATGAGAAGTAGAGAAGTSSTVAATTAATVVPTATSALAPTTTGTAAAGNAATLVNEASSVNQIASNVINTANANTAAGGTPIVSPTLSDAVEKTINSTTTISDGGALTQLRQQQALKDQYAQLGLENLAEATQSSINRISTPVSKPSTSLLSPEGVTFDTDLSTVSVNTADSFRPSATNPFDKNTTSFDNKLLADLNIDPTSDPSTYASQVTTTVTPTKKSSLFKLPEGTGEYAAQVGVGTATSLLTGAILGPDEPESGAGMLVSYDKAEAPAASYVADVSRSYQNNGGTPLTFDMYTKQTMPMYGPASPRALAANPYLYAT
jgi:hypothetical protein